MMLNFLWDLRMAIHDCGRNLLLDDDWLRGYVFGFFPSFIEIVGVAVYHIEILHSFV